MNRSISSLFAFALLSGTVFAQTDETAPAFELADVHASPKGAINMRGGFIRNGRFEVRTATMVDLIATAYGIDNNKILGGPTWLDSDRFDIIAKAPPATTQATAKLMLQKLLADRFSLKFHNDTKAMPAFVLTLGKGKPKLKEASDGPSTCQGVPQTQPTSPGLNVVACRKMTMDALALNLLDMANAYLTNSVVNKTGLAGNWDFELRWTSRGQIANAGSDAITIFDAVDKQLGLKLEPQNLPVAVLRIDSVNQTPTENAPGVISKLPPPPPTEFEVAEIKPSKPDAQGQNGRIQNGRVDLSNMTLQTLISLAWDLTGPEMMADGPKFLTSVHYDVIAKAPAGVAATEQEADVDTLRLMLRALLEERFLLKSHMEDRPVSAYVLSASKPKLTKADPQNRTGCKEGPGADGKDPRVANPVLNRLLTCENMTMAQFAAQLPNLANGYVHSGVLDTTGLSDAYDFTISFSGAGLVNGGGRSSDGTQGAATEPNGALSLPDAIAKQLGLKLELVKRPVQVLVIDHIEEKPTEN